MESIASLLHSCEPAIAAFAVLFVIAMIIQVSDEKDEQRERIERERIERGEVNLGPAPDALAHNLLADALEKAEENKP